MSTMPTYLRLGLHVGASDVEVIRAARTRLDMSKCVGTKALRLARRRFYLSILHDHRDAQQLFRTYRF